MVFTVIFFIRKITIYESFIRHVKAGNTEVSDLDTLNVLADCEEKLKIRKTVEVYRNSFITSPIMIGFVSPSIIIPVKQITKEELSYIFTHELIHYKRRDMFYKWFIQIITCIHWFNPFVYLLEKEINKACELSCDEAVICSLDHKARKAYGDMLLSLISDNTYGKSLASVTLSSGARQIKERLGAIMNFKKKSKTITVAAALLTFALCFAFIATGAYAAPGAISNNTDTISTDTASTDTTSSTSATTYSRDGIYYIYCDGADENDKPDGYVSDEYNLFILVRKDSFTTVGPFKISETTTEDIEQQCDDMLAQGNITVEEKSLVLEKADNVQMVIKH